MRSPYASSVSPAPSYDVAATPGTWCYTNFVRTLQATPLARLSLLLAVFSDGTRATPNRGLLPLLHLRGYRSLFDGVLQKALSSSEVAEGEENTN